jgi:ATP phosphoribosyltransferase
VSDSLIFALPAKGRLMDQCNAALAKAGLTVGRSGAARGYTGAIAELPGVEVKFVSASEIAQFLRSGAVHVGITGEDLVREAMADADERVAFLRRCDFGRADVVVAVPASWLDVRRVADLEELAPGYRRLHGRQMRIATKYMNLARRFFAERGVTGYRIVESLGATEGAPAAGLADLIVDITTSGATLRANGLKVLDDGIILRSQASLIAARSAPWSQRTRALADQIALRICG